MSGLVWLASYPKSGNTWLRVVLANLRRGEAAPADINELGTTQIVARELIDRLIGWESAELTPEELEALRFPVQEALARTAQDMPVKTHEAFRDPRTGRPLYSAAATRCVLYVVRHPLDVVVSLSQYLGLSVDSTIEFMNDPLAGHAFGPEISLVSHTLGDWSEHVRGWTDAEGMNVCVLRYEDMMANPEATFARAAQAAGWPTDATRIARAVENSRFERLQRQEAEKGFVESSRHAAFFRAGRSGGWKQLLTPRQVGAILERHATVMRRFGYTDD